MRIELLSLILNNFKGVQHFELNANGHDAVISGSNGSGKTSLFDAWLWLLFDMDSRGSKGADASKTTKGTDFVHNLVHEVVATISVDGKTVTLRKTLTENWVKKRGEETQTFSGNVSNYWIDDVPTQLKDYSAYINALIPADLFKIISDPLYFSEQMKWQDRLSMLVEISGGISEEDVARGDRALESLLVKMGDKNFSDFKKMTQEKIRLINNEIDSIPARIDEQKRSIPQAADYCQTEKDLKAAESAMETLNAEEMSVKDAMKPLMEMHDKVFRLTREKDAMIDLVLKEGNASRTAKSEKLQLLVAEKRQSGSNKESLQYGIDASGKRIEKLNADNQKLRTAFSDIQTQVRDLSSEEFVVGTGAGEEVCPTCGQKLSDEWVNGKIEDCRAGFEQRKAEDILALQKSLEALNREGKNNAIEIQTLQSQIDSDTALLRQADEHDAAVSAQIELLQKETLETPVMLPAQAEQDLRVQIIDQQILDLNIKLSATSEDRSEELALSKKTIQSEIDRCKTILFAREMTVKAQQRIADLEIDLKAKGTTKTALEGDIFQCERFVRARTEKLEGKINGMFTKVGFKLFAEQVNGGLSETCEAVVNNTTFSKANTAGQINAGMDIIRTISRYKGLYVPVFVDHLESINDLLPLPSQVISLLVSRDADLQVLVSQSSKQEVD